MNCFKSMEERVADPINAIDFSTSSPATVILPESRCAATDPGGRFSDMSIFHPKHNFRKRKNTNGRKDR